MPQTLSENICSGSTWSGNETKSRAHASKSMLLHGSVLVLFTYAFTLTVLIVAMHHRLGKTEETLQRIKKAMSKLEVTAGNNYKQKSAQSAIRKGGEDKMHLEEERHTRSSSWSNEREITPNECSCQNGSKGSKGNRGVKGAKGDEGVAGTTGQTGMPGLNGRKGEPGDQGREGDKGSSAFRAAVAVHTVNSGNLNLDDQPSTNINGNETINFLVSDDSMLLIPPTDSNIILSSNGLHLKLPGIYYIYCQVSIGAPANEVDVSLVQDAIAVATGLSGSVNFPKTVFLGRLICVRNRRGSYINVKVKSLKPATIWLNGRNTYVGAFLVGPLSGTMNNSNHC
ncbi:uncharacterized protein LOC134196696 isoform X2 [Corticium candelabrum]|uniref:uncharacterized protein LOC134196696 isoform X2 n=1 Tax=Corticium candelabrum TaxID=121492 RepID=UPI002E26024F|nr:uncharacterized protein LOC134196696 isoform X2 [Corticium candelabrum]